MNPKVLAYEAEAFDMKSAAEQQLYAFCNYDVDYMFGNWNSAFERDKRYRWILFDVTPMTSSMPVRKIIISTPYHIKEDRLQAGEGIVCTIDDLVVSIRDKYVGVMSLLVFMPPWCLDSVCKILSESGFYVNEPDPKSDRIVT